MSYNVLPYSKLTFEPKRAEIKMVKLYFSSDFLGKTQTFSSDFLGETQTFSSDFLFIVKQYLYLNTYIVIT